ncbi:MAG: hypothetical protein GKR94_07510 [Gammaproteobacteria bacterium]|nr:hypothetical protein [Gammaproteobacteria bacterium]
MDGSADGRNFSGWGALSLCAAILLGSVLSAPPVMADQEAGNPCAYQPIDVDRYGGHTFHNPPALSSTGGILRSADSAVRG